MPNFNNLHFIALASLTSLFYFYPSLVNAQQLLARTPHANSITHVIQASSSAYVAYSATDAYGTDADVISIANGNVQVRAGTTGDSDGDSVPDIIDVDDDNDTIPDDVEGTVDTDLDGVVDCLDVDSDNDGITDLFEAVAGSGLMLLVDADRDGKLDATVAVGDNGLADVVELSPESSTSQTGNADFDGDGIRDHQDLDVDNDGIPDVVEAGSGDEQFDGRYDLFVDLDGDGLADGLLSSPIEPIDSDQDGIEDFRDLDSDQDGLTDRLETVGVDTDSNGQVDNLIDANIDGLDDGYQSRATALPDTDNDGFPDFRDVDSDGDGITDSEEAFGGVNPGTSVNSPTPFNPQTDAQNEEITLQTGESGNVFGCSLSYDQKIRQSFDPIFLLMLGVFAMIARRRHTGLSRVHRHLTLPASALGVLLVSGCAIAQQGSTIIGGERQPYAGIGLGASFLNADTSDLPFDQSKSNSAAGQLTLGLSFDKDLSLEARLADLGQATFTSGDAVGYQVVDVSGLYKRHSRRYSGFARLGIGALFNDGDIRATQKNKVHLLVGFGAEYNLSSRVALRAEWQGHDVDVMHSQLSVLYRFGANANRANSLIAENNNAQNGTNQKLSDADFQAVPDKSNEQEMVAIGERASPPAQPETKTAEPPVTESKPETAAASAASPESVADAQVAANAGEAAQQQSSSSDDIAKIPPVATSDEQIALATAQGNPAAAQLPGSPDSTSNQSENVTTPVEAAKDGVNDALGNCLDADTDLSAAAVGCSLFEDLVPGLTFVPDTDQLTESGEVVLDTVADGLAKESDLQVTVAVHTAPATDANEAMFLTRRRTIAIIRYLSDKGIDATRLRPEAYGDTQPLADAKNPTDNDRVVLSTR